MVNRKKSQKKTSKKTYKQPSYQRYELKDLKEGWKLYAFGRLNLDPECTSCYGQPN